MGRILAIDYGQKRVGLAVTDELKLIATKLTTVHSKDIIAFLKNYISSENVEIFVVGLPRQMNGKLSESVKYIDPFIKKLQHEFPSIPIERIDERFTSKIATQAILNSGAKKKKRQDKALVDTVSATIILQSYLDK
ncbi:MAG: Holliday junction resolvase RuvX, partial [Chlorobi bacterium]|nr:Holliday junction resolvase RuvX [Chlorobiota bacterium]